MCAVITAKSSEQRQRRLAAAQRVGASSCGVEGARVAGDCGCVGTYRHPCKASRTARMPQSITPPSGCGQSIAGQASTVLSPSKTCIPVMSSLIRTTPSPSQSPTQAAGGSSAPRSMIPIAKSATAVPAHSRRAAPMMSERMAPFRLSDEPTATPLVWTRRRCARGHVVEHPGRVVERDLAAPCRCGGPGQAVTVYRLGAATSEPSTRTTSAARPRAISPGPVSPNRWP